jgi:hypothetical protein
MFETKYNPTIEIMLKKTPKYNACVFEILPSGIGLKHVRDITASISESYHILSAPAAPAPNATKNNATADVKKSTCLFEIIKPTRAVKTTRDITLGFIKL